MQWATTSWQASGAAPLAQLPLLEAGAGIGAPAALVVGHVAALAQELSWVAPLSVRSESDGLSSYRRLRVANSSPYMFFLRNSGMELAGSSPDRSSGWRAAE